MLSLLFTWDKTRILNFNDASDHHRKTHRVEDMFKLELNL